MENLKKLTKQLRCNLYSDFGTDLESAFNAMNVLATASKNPAAVYTAAYGIINTLCNVIDAEANSVSDKLRTVNATLEEASVLVAAVKKYVEEKE